MHRGWIHFLARAYWGKNFNRELKLLMLNYAFQFVNSAYFFVGDTNYRSQKAMQRIGALETNRVTTPQLEGGFTHFGHIRDHEVQLGKPMKFHSVLVHTNPDTFTESVQGFLEQNEAENGLFLGVLALLKSEPPTTIPFMAEIKAGPNTIAAALYRDRNLIITRGSKEIWATVATKIKEAAIDIPGVVGPASDAEYMAAAWSKVYGCEFNLAMNQRLYTLIRVDWPTGISGRARLVTEEDVDLLTIWIHEFYREALPWEIPAVEQIRENAVARVPARMTFFWEVDGNPVAMTALARPSTRGISVNAVYTPPEHRKHGYATALVAAVSAEGLKRGSEFCALYTDLMNPISNSIYQKIGYRPISDSRNYRFRYPR